MSRQTYAIVAACVFLAGGLLAGYSVREQRSWEVAEAVRLLTAFDDKPEVSDREERALAEIAQASRGVRVAFLSAALVDAKWTARLGAHEHALSVALSQVDRREARELFDEVLLPCLGTFPDASVLHACVSLTQRWGLAAEAAEEKASDIVTRLLNERDPYVKRSLASAVSAFAPHLEEKNADTVAAQLLSAIGDNFDRLQLAPLLSALQEVAKQASDSKKSETAKTIVERLVFEKELASLPAWSAVLGSLDAATPETTANDLVSQLLTRLEPETRAAAVLPLVTALNSLAARVDAEHAERIAHALIPRFRQPDIVSLDAETSSIVLLADKLHPETIEQARAALLDSLRNQSDAKAMSIVAFSLGELSEGIAKGGFDEAVKILVGKMRRQDGSYELTLLDAALENLVKSGVSPGAALDATSVLVERIEREQHIPEFLRIAVGIEILADSVPEQSAERFAARLIDRMRESSGAAVLRALAFLIGDLDASRAQVRTAAAKLSQRVAVENDPSALRGLVAGLLNLGDDVPADAFEDAEARARKLLAIETSEKGLEDLTATLDALEERESDHDDLKDEAPELDEAVARKLLDPLVEPAEWVRLALPIAPLDTAAKDDDEDEESMDFHTLLVADDDGESDTEVRAFPIDFPRLSDALDRFRPQRSHESRMTLAVITGAGMMAVGAILAILAARGRR